MPRERSLWSDDPRKVWLLRWLTTPKQERVPKTQQALADEMNIHIRTLRDWMNDPLFREAWEREAKSVAANPERAQAVLDTLYAAAVDPAHRFHVQAAKLYLEATNAIKPAAIEVRMAKPADLTDDELDQLLAHGAAALRAERDEGEAVEAEQ